MVNINTYGKEFGQTDLRTTGSERIVWWGRDSRNLYTVNKFIDSTVTDSGSTPTTNIRAGHLLAEHTSSGNLYMWDPEKDDGRDVFRNVLMEPAMMLDDEGVAAKTYGHVILAGALRADELLIDGAAFVDHKDEWVARRQMTMAGRYMLSDDVPGAAAALGLHLAQRDEAESVTLTDAYHGMLITTTGATGAVTFTLPAIRGGLAFEFLNTVDQNMVIASAEGDNIVGEHNATADNITFSTGNEKIGARILVHANDAGTLWMVRHYSIANTATTNDA